jgi:hypothetical protein
VLILVFLGLRQYLTQHDYLVDVSKTVSIYDKGEIEIAGQTLLVHPAQVSCSGFIVGRVNLPNGQYGYYIMTAAHCMSREAIYSIGELQAYTDTVPVYIKFADGTKAVVRNYRASKFRDIGIIQVTTTKDYPVAEFSIQHYQVGDTLYGFGAPSGVEKTLLRGIVSRDASMDIAASGAIGAAPTIEKETIVAECGMCAGGASGAGIFNTSSYKIEGMEVAGSRTDAMNFLVPASQLIKFYHWYMDHRSNTEESTIWNSTK